MTALMTVAMMVAMMLPSFAPTLWRYHRHLGAARTPRAGQRTTLFAVGYASVWATIGLALFAMSAELSPMDMASPRNPPFAPWAAGAVVLCVGAVQRSRWKARQLLRCRQACVTASADARNVMRAWRDGCQLGIDCGLSCAGPMAVLFVAGLMDARVMGLVTTAITAERVVPAGARIARLTGALALVAGLVICAQAIELTVSGTRCARSPSHASRALGRDLRGGRVSLPAVSEITATAMQSRASYIMPVLQSGAESCGLQAGTYTLGGRGPNALPLASLEGSPEVATIVVPPSGASTIQRLTASIVVRVDQTAIGIAPKVLPDGVEIEFNGCRLTFRTDDTGDATLTSTPPDEARLGDRLIPESHALPPEPTTHAGKVRIVNVRTGTAIDLGESRVVVGRDEACNIVVPGVGVSRRHCSIAPVQGGYLLRDESANGTLVNGSRISGTYLLDHGDVLRVCDEELRFEVEGGALPATSTTAPPTAILDVSRLRSEHAAGGTHEWPAAPLAACLEIVRGPFAGASFSIDRPVCSIGRAAENDVRIRDESVSSNHATLLRKGGAWFVVDLRSANGTFVDGSRIAAERAVTSGSRLKLGHVELTFRAIEAGVEPANTRKRSRPWPLELLISFFSRSSRAVSENA